MENFSSFLRRRVGKTTILKEFSGRLPTIFYSAQEKNDGFENGALGT